MSSNPTDKSAKQLYLKTAKLFQMTNLELKDTLIEDIEDLLIKVEQSFNIKFVGDELVNILTFGELCDHIANKVKLEQVDDCTSQQAFYKLREAISNTFNMDSKSITVDLPLTDILPRKNRRQRTKKLEKHLGFKLNILRPLHLVTWILVLSIITSLVLLFIIWPIGLPVFVVSAAGLLIANKLGKELDLKTLGQLAEKITRENYLKSRRNPNTVNKKEIEKVLMDWFSDEFYLDKTKLTRDAKFV